MQGSRGAPRLQVRAYPTRGQRVHAEACLDAHRQLYNAALEERREAWRHGVTVRYGDQSAQLTAIRRADPDGQGRWSFTSQQQTLRRLGRAFQGFFDRVRRVEEPATPDSSPEPDGTRSTSSMATVPVGRSRKGCGRGQPSRVGHLKVKCHRRVSGQVKALRLNREGRRWYVVVVAEQLPMPLPATGREIGLDLGVARFATTSDGQVLANPRFRTSTADELVATQQAVARRQPGSGNRRKAKRKLAKLHRKIANRRRDFHHKTARRLINGFDVIAVEDLARLPT